jgi:hypothetical protein
MRIYEPYLNHLKHCGGCVIPFSIVKCKFAWVCSYVESLAKEGEIESAEDLCSPSNNELTGLKPRTSPRTGISEEWPRRGSYRDYNKEFEQG